MKFKILLVFLLLDCFVKSEIKSPEIEIKEGERVIVFAPHPDDEIIENSGLILKVLENKGEIWIVYLTNGDHNQLAFKAYEKKLILKPSDYIKLGEIRRKESIKATEILGVKRENLIFLGYPDFGTLKIWEDFWGKDTKPFKSFFTRATKVPYKENYSYENPYIGDSIVSDIEKIINEINPNKVFITSPFDINVDHRALFNFVNVALLNLMNKCQPEVYLYLIHFKNYPNTKKYISKEFLFPPDSLSNLSWFSILLNEEEIDKKFLAINCFKSQMILRKNWFYSFVRKNEIFCKFQPVSIENGSEISFESEEEFENPKKKTIPFTVALKKINGEIEIVLIHKKKFIEPIDYTFYLYGWKSNFPFSLMPKAKLVIEKGKGTLILKNFFQKYKVNLDKEKGRVSFKIELEKIGKPDFLFFSSKITIGNISYDFIPWRVIEIEKNKNFSFEK